MLKFTVDNGRQFRSGVRRPETVVEAEDAADLLSVLAGWIGMKAEDYPKWVAPRVGGNPDDLDDLVDRIVDKNPRYSLDKTGDLSLEANYR